MLWSWKYDPEGGTFSGRLAGDSIEAIFGRSFRNARMADMFPPDAYGGVLARNRRVITGPCLFHGRGAIFNGSRPIWSR